MMKLLWTLAALIGGADAVSIHVPTKETECAVLLPHEKLDNAEGSFVVSGNVRVDFAVTAVARNWSESGKEIYRRNYQNAANFDVTAGSDVPVGFVFRLCWTNRHSDQPVNIFFKKSTMLIDMKELAETGKDVYSVAKLLSQLENQLEQEVSDFRVRSEASESTLEGILWMCVTQFVLVIGMALIQARSMRKMFETQLMI